MPSPDCTLDGYLRVLNFAGRGPDSSSPLNADFFDVSLSNQARLFQKPVMGPSLVAPDKMVKVMEEAGVGADSILQESIPGPGKRVRWSD